MRSLTLLDPAQEPVFVSMMNDPQFAETANSLMWGDDSVSHGGKFFMNHPSSCAGCLQHKAEAERLIAESEITPTGRRRRSTPVVQGVVTDDSPAARRARARSHGPRSNKGKK